MNNSKTKETEVTILTTKLDIFPVGTKEEKTAMYKRLRDIRYMSWKDANLIMSSFFATKFAEEQIFRHLTTLKNFVNKKASDVFLEIYRDGSEAGYTKQNIPYRIVTEGNCKDVCANIRTCLANRVFKDINIDKSDILSGRKAVRQYRLDKMNIYFSGKELKFCKTEEGYINISMFPQTERFSFGIKFGRDASGNRTTINRIMSGEYNIGDSYIKIAKKGLAMFLSVKIPKKKAELDANTHLGVDLGLAVPAFIATNNSEFRRALGSYDDFTKQRNKIRNSIDRLKKSLIFTKGSHGRNRKLAALESSKDKERRWVRNYNHKLSSEIIKAAIKQRAAVIKLELLKGYGKDDDNEVKDNWVLSRWSYFELQSMIEYKATKYGIQVVKIDPYHTSQTCSVCGHYEKGQRETQSQFKCKACGIILNADYNAAKNIASSINIVTDVKQTQWYKQKQKEAKKKHISSVEELEELEMFEQQTIQPTGA